MDDAVNILFILGLSGTGKTSMAEHIAKKNNWLHLDLDQIGSDGFEVNGLTEVWQKFKTEKNADPLIQAIKSRYKTENKVGAVLSFPSTRKVEANAIERVKKDINVVYLSGSKEDCLNAFLKREKINSRNLSEDHWIKFNSDMLAFLSNSKLKQYKMEVFKANGEHRPMKELLQELNCLSQ